MEEADVVICGAGPSGLVLGILLAKYKIKTIILEKAWQVEEDPRGIAMVSDASRIIHSIGLGEDMTTVSQGHSNLNFHLDTFRNKPYLKMRQDFDWANQTLPQVVFFSQPMFEKSMRDRVNDSKYSEVRVGCEVIARTETEDHVIIEYKSTSPGTETDGATRKIKARWLIGADGKKGVVRKKFLEPFGITQQVSSYEYSGTWIAANLQISLPTPETHPDLPVWKLNLSPEQLYDIFWPDEWHFCTHPSEPIAAGRFGPPEKKLWRHEFELTGWKTGMDAEEIFWRHLTPLITLNETLIPGLEGEMLYPRDCIKVLRCRPFTFVQRVAGPRWFNNRTIIIGDAAHVFPPFGGQGIASGVRDAFGLAWRLAILLKASSHSTPAREESNLMSWNQERLKGIEQAVETTMVNGTLTNQKNRWATHLQIAVSTFLMAIPALLQFLLSFVLRDDRGYKTVEKGCFLPDSGGGGKLSQIYMRSSKTGRNFLSDALINGTASIFTVLAVVDRNASQIVEDVGAAIKKAELDPFLLSRDSIRRIALHQVEGEDVETFTPCSATELAKEGIAVLDGYDERSYYARLGGRAKFAVIRPDAIIFCTADTLQQLEVCLVKLGQVMEGR